MRSAVDTNVISALWSKEPAAVGMADLLFSAKQAGSLAICAAVYAELLAYPGADRAFVDGFLHNTQIEVQGVSPQVWTLAGTAFSDYAQRRRQNRDGQPKRLLVDFIVGAHALLEADRLLTLGGNRYRTAYPDLNLSP